MFFPRIRRHAKWVFVLLALVFGLGFVVFGVGAGGTGIGDVLRGGGSSSDTPSVKKALAAAQKDPSKPQAWRDLSTAYQTEGDNTKAIGALQQLTTLRPNDLDGLRQLASLYLAVGSQKSYDASLARFFAVYNGGSGPFAPTLPSASGSPIFTNKLSSVVDATASSQEQSLSTEASNAYTQAVDAFKRVARLSKGDPNVQLELGQAAQQAGDYATALAAYKRYVALAPDSSTTPAVKQQIAALQSTLAGASSNSSK